LTDPDTPLTPEPGTPPPTVKGPTLEQFALILAALAVLLTFTCFGLAMNRLDVALPLAVIIVLLIVLLVFVLIVISVRGRSSDRSKEPPAH
jgi:hypothetical protein